VRYGARAVALAPHDVAARANLARALVLSGDEPSARAHLAVVRAADHEDKQDAFIGELTNRVFVLHMTLGERDDAEADSRRLLLGPGIRHAQGLLALAAVELCRGDFDRGLTTLASAADGYDAVHMEAAAAVTHWERAWQAFNLGRPDVVAASCERLVARAPAKGALAQLAPMASLLRLLARDAAAEPSETAALLARLDAPAAGGRRGRWRAYLDIVTLHRRHDWAGAVRAYRERATRADPLAVAWFAADAMERLGDRASSAARFERLATHPAAWQQPYRRGQAWVRVAAFRERRGDVAGARAAYAALLALWDRASPRQPEKRAAEDALGRLATARG
jgi:hypothetical protein